MSASTPRLPSHFKLHLPLLLFWCPGATGSRVHLYSYRHSNAQEPWPWLHEPCIPLPFHFPLSGFTHASQQACLTTQGAQSGWEGWGLIGGRGELAQICIPSGLRGLLANAAWRSAGRSRVASVSCREFNLRGGPDVLISQRSLIALATKAAAASVAREAIDSPPTTAAALLSLVVQVGNWLVPKWER